MIDVDRYLTDEAADVAAARYADTAGLGWSEQSRMLSTLRAALPHVEPLIRADVLREAADYLAARTPPGGHSLAAAVLDLRRLADEAVAGGR